MTDPVFSRERGTETRQAPYRKIAATGWISRLLPGARSAIYLGGDHLLHAKQIMLFEKYRRFYFSLKDKKQIELVQTASEGGTLVDAASSLTT